MTYHLSSEEKQLIRQWVLEGRPWSWIHHELERAPETVRRFIYKLDQDDPKFAASRRRKAPALSKREQAQIRKWLLQGKTQDFIQLKLGRSGSTVSRYRKHLVKTDPEVAAYLTPNS